MTSVTRNDKKTTASPGSSSDRIKQFLQETWVELRYKVSWPDKPKLVKSTAVVLTVVVIISIFVYVVDLALGAILRNTILR